MLCGPLKSTLPFSCKFTDDVLNQGQQDDLWDYSTGVSCWTKFKLIPKKEDEKALSLCENRVFSRRVKGSCQKQLLIRKCLKQTHANKSVTTAKHALQASQDTEPQVASHAKRLWNTGALRCSIPDFNMVLVTTETYGRLEVLMWRQGLTRRKPL
jgi:hypothetical protein